MKYLPKFLVIPLLLLLLNGLAANAADFGGSDPDGQGNREERSRPRVQVQVLWRFTDGQCRWVNAGDTQPNGWQVADDSTCVNDPPATQNGSTSQDESGSDATGTDSDMRARGFVLWRYTGGQCRWVNPGDTQPNGWQVADDSTCVNGPPTTQTESTSQDESSSDTPGTENGSDATGTDSGSDATGTDNGSDAPATDGDMRARGFVLWRYTGGLCRWVNAGDTQANGWQVADATSCTSVAP